METYDEHSDVFFFDGIFTWIYKFLYKRRNGASLRLLPDIDRFKV